MRGRAFAYPGSSILGHHRYVLNRYSRTGWRGSLILACLTVRDVSAYIPRLQIWRKKGLLGIENWSAHRNGGWGHRETLDAFGGAL
jgi:hypothetical protein